MAQAAVLGSAACPATVEGSADEALRHPEVLERPADWRLSLSDHIVRGIDAAISYDVAATL